MGIYIGIGNYIGSSKVIGVNRDPHDLYANLLTERNSNILTEEGFLILKEMQNLLSEDELFLITEDNKYIFREDSIYPEGIVVAYECYDKTNDSINRSKLQDLTGNGHDIQLYNFDFAEASGFGLYSVDMNSITYKDSDKSYRLNYNTFNLKGVKYPVIRVPILNKQINVVINVNIKNEYTKNLLDVYYFKEDGTTTVFIKRGLVNGINTINYTIPEEDNPVNFVIAWRNSTTNVDVDIEFIPDYKGALVSDGVDDYGLCENFPILTKEKGYTVCAIRKILQDASIDGTFLSQGDIYGWTFVVELIYAKQVNSRNFSNNQAVRSESPKDLFVFQNSKSYNGEKDLKIGDIVCNSNNLVVFAHRPNYYPIKSALYALEIYDRDLTDEEIALVKERMIKRYEEKTGETYVEEVTA